MNDNNDGAGASSAVSWKVLPHLSGTDQTARVVRVDPCESVFLTPSNGVLPALPTHVEQQLASARTERCADGSAFVVEAGDWTWGGDRRTDLVGQVTFRRHGRGVWDLRVSVVVDPDDLERCDWTVVVQRSRGVLSTEEGEVLCPPIDRWQASAEVLAPVERADILRLAEEAVADPPPAEGLRRSTAAVHLEANGACGRLVVDLDRGVAAVLVDEPLDEPLPPAAREAAESALRHAVEAGVVDVPRRTRVLLDLGVLRLEGGTSS